ncbi:MULTISPECIES: hypothetical protein [Demequina]|uniref:ATP/GTP-binding protein n=1 Tax=Demequina litorisediminis TaxID=1849022 RepID=A0ABQ6IFL0_9MICO|nr:hypothetical protein [Demequina litorisediminis]GMA36684.1 hypothetical protein GCM10025876_28880 [Demequina litorisediminis]
MPKSRRSRKRPYGQPHEELDVERLSGSLGGRRESGPGGEEYLVATPRPSEKTYTCPGCSQEIDGQTVHVVAWPADGLFGPEAAAAQRRHWHTHCWNTFGRTRG